MKLTLVIIQVLVCVIGDIQFVQCIDFDGFANKCSACLNSNPRYRYVCGICTDDKRPTDRGCGTIIT